MSVEMGSGALNSAALMAILIPHMEKRFSADLDQHPSHEASQRRDRVLALPGPVLAVPGPVPKSTLPVL